MPSRTKTNPPSAPTPPEAAPLRVILFGPPGAGKSALLAALGQVRQTQEAQLKGELADVGGGLERQRQLHYDGQPPPSPDGTATHPVRFQPARKKGAPPPLEAVLIDCDGEQAHELLKRPLPLAEKQPPGDLPCTLLDADALILVADAAMPAAQAERFFASVEKFLDLLEQGRGARNETAGLPVFLVLTKCDLLASKKLTPADWLEQIEERKREAFARLGDFLAGAGHPRPAAFGRLNFHVWATALKRPPLAGAPARGHDPYGVAELFRQCLDEAAAYRQRRHRARRRLAWTVGGAAGVAVVLVGMTAALLAGLWQREVSALQVAIEQYRAREGNSVAARLGYSPEDLGERLDRLEHFREHPGFGAVPDELQGYVLDRRRELNDYIPYLKNVLNIESPFLATSLGQLEERLERLRTELAPPRSEWSETGAGQLRQRLIEDITLLSEKVRDVEGWYQRLKGEGIALWTFQQARQGNLINWRAWQDRVDEYLRKADATPGPLRNLPPESLLSPSLVFQFEQVREARQRVQQSVRELQALRNISFALGLADPTALRPALLDIPRDFSPAEAQRRWDRLRNHPRLPASLSGLLAAPAPFSPLAAAAFPPEHPLVSPYPNYREEFTLDNVPDAARPAITQAAGNSYRYVIEPARDLIRQRYGEIGEGDAESAERWRTLAGWLAGDPEKLRSYRRLAVVLSRLKGPPPHDPVAALTEFLRREQFTFAMDGAEVRIPFEWEVRVSDGAALTVRAGEQTASFPLKSTKRDPETRVTTYTFQGPVRRIGYRPGERFEATLGLRGDRQLTWNVSRTKSYAFEALHTAPWLHDKSRQPERGTRAEGISLTTQPAGAVPRMPDFLPRLNGNR